MAGFALQQALTKRTTNQRASRADSLVGTKVVDSWLESWVDLNQVHGDEAASLVDALGDEVSLSQGKTSADWGTGGRSDDRVESVDIEGEVDWGVGADVGECHLHNASDAVPVDC